MNIDISKYLKNKDIKVKNDDFDIEALSSELRKGFVDEKEVDRKVTDQVKTQLGDMTSKYTDLETKYTDLEKRNVDLSTRNQTLSLEKAMIGKGFKEEQFEEVSKLRNSLYADEKDDVKAITSIADKFKATYFGDTKPATPSVPNEAGINGAGNGQNQPKQDITINRNTRLRDMVVSK